MQNLSLFLTRISDNPHQPLLQRHPLCFLSKITITKTNSKTFSASSQVSNTAYSVTINYPSRNKQNLHYHLSQHPSHYLKKESYSSAQIAIRHYFTWNNIMAVQDTIRVLITHIILLNPTFSNTVVT